MDKRLLSAALLLFTLSIAGEGREGCVRSAAAAPPAAAPRPAAVDPPAEAKRPRVLIHKGAVEDVDPEEGWIILRTTGSGAFLSLPVSSRVPLDNLKAGDNVAVTVKDGQAVSIRPFRPVPKGLRNAPSPRPGKVLSPPGPPSPAGPAPPSPASRN